MTVTLPLSTDIITNYNCSHIYDYDTTHRCLHRYTCMTHSFLYNYIVEYDSSTSLLPILDILIPTVFDKCLAFNLLCPSILQKIVQGSLTSTIAALQTYLSKRTCEPL